MAGKSIVGGNDSGSGVEALLGLAVTESCQTFVQISQTRQLHCRMIGASNTNASNKSILFSYGVRRRFCTNFGECEEGKGSINTLCIGVGSFGAEGEYGKVAMALGESTTDLLV